MTEYYIPAGAGESEYIEKRSQFIGRVRPVESEEEARAFIAEMKKTHYDARHNCWCHLLKTASSATPTTASRRARPGCRCWRSSAARA